MLNTGIHPRLRDVVTAVDAWCRDHSVKYDIGVDESDLQGVKIFQKDRGVIGGLLNNISQLLNANRVHVETQKVRGGTIIAFSLAALSEMRMRKLLYQLGEELEHMTFADRIADALTRSPTPATPRSGPLAEDELLETAHGILGRPVSARDGNLQVTAKLRGSQLDDITVSDVTQGVGNPYSTSLLKFQFPKLYTELMREVQGSPAPAATPSTRPPAPFGRRVAEAMDSTYERPRRSFFKQLREALGGIATQTGAQPQDLFTKFAKALRVLGDQMGVGPLQDRLKEQGINWKKSDDAQSIILYIINGTTKAPQPIARISAETLESPNDFQDQLTTMLDFAKGDAPGAFKQKQEELKNQERAVRDIARAVAPPGQQSEAGRAMNASPAPPGAAGAAGAAPAPAPAAPAPVPAVPAPAPAQPAPAAGPAAATQAAAPKPAHPSM